MKYYFFLNFFLFVLIFSGCQENITSKKPDNKIVSEIQNLNTTEKQQLFLENIFEEDQSVRIKNNELSQKYGVDSKKNKNNVEKMMALDRSNLQKIEMYLKVYGHPTIEKHGEKASYAPWIVIHHSSTTDARKGNFPYLYEAYKSGNLKESYFVSYLDRYYAMEFGKRYEKERYYPQEKITEIIEALDLKVRIK